MITEIKGAEVRVLRGVDGNLPGSTTGCPSSDNPEVVECTNDIIDGC